MSSSIKVIVGILLFCTFAHSEELSLDLNCDGKKDFAKLTPKKDSAELTIKIAEIDKEFKFEFATGNATSQFATCSTTVSLNAAVLADWPANALGSLPEGYQVSESCHQVEISDTDCDSLYFYWNHTKGEVYWWRL